MKYIMSKRQFEIGLTRTYSLKLYQRQFSSRGFRTWQNKDKEGFQISIPGDGTFRFRIYCNDMIIIILIIISKELKKKCFGNYGVLDIADLSYKSISHLTSDKLTM